MLGSLKRHAMFRKEASVDGARLMEDPPEPCGPGAESTEVVSLHHSWPS